MCLFLGYTKISSKTSCVASNAQDESSMKQFWKSIKRFKFSSCNFTFIASEQCFSILLAVILRLLWKISRMDEKQAAFEQSANCKWLQNEEFPSIKHLQ